MDAQANHLNVVDDWIYFSDLTDRNYCISKARTDGTDIMKLTDDLSSFLNISDGWIFYTNESEENKLYKMRLDGSEKNKLSEDVVNSPNTVGEEIYYIKFNGDFYYYNYGTENGKLYKIKTYGGGRSLTIPAIDNLENQEVTLSSFVIYPNSLAVELNDLQQTLSFSLVRMANCCQCQKATS